MREVFGEEFRGAQLFLDNATYGLPSRRQTEVLHQMLDSWDSGALAGPKFDEPVRRARQAFADLAGVPARTVAMGGSASGLVGLIAAAAADGTRVATVPGEFTSVTAPFDAQSGRGVTVTVLEPGELERRAGEFDLVAVSLVQSADGRVLDLDALRSAIGRHTRVLLDVTQAMGWKELDLAWADVVVCAGYKWVLAPRGIAWMAVREDLWPELVPHAASWYSSEDPWANTYQQPPRLAADARRFDTSPAWLPALGASISLPWLAGLDGAAIEQHCVGLANQVREAAGMPAADSAIVALDRPGLAERVEQAGIRATVRAGRVRVGFHLYNTEDDAARFIEVLHQ